MNKPFALEGCREYQAWTMDNSVLLAEGDSYRSLGSKIGISGTSVRKYMNWHLGAQFHIDGELTQGLLTEVGQLLRTVYSRDQLHNKDKLPTLVLNGITLDQLTPRRIYAIDIHTLTIDPSLVYSSVKEL